MLQHDIRGGPLTARRVVDGGSLNRASTVVDRSWCTWSCRGIHIIIVVQIGVITVRTKVHEVSDIEIVFVILRVVVFVVIEGVHALRPDADKRIEGFRRANAVIAEKVIISGSGSEDASKHNVRVDCIVEDFVAVLAVGYVELRERSPRTVVGGAARAAVGSVDWKPWNCLCTWTVERYSFGGSVSNSNGFCAVVVNKDAASGRDLAPSRPRAPLKGVRSRCPGAWR